MALRDGVLPGLLHYTSMSMNIKCGNRACNVGLKIHVVLLLLPLQQMFLHYIDTRDRKGDTVCLALYTVPGVSLVYLTSFHRSFLNLYFHRCLFFSIRFNCVPSPLRLLRRSTAEFISYLDFIPSIMATAGSEKLRLL